MPLFPRQQDETWGVVVGDGHQFKCGVAPPGKVDVVIAAVRKRKS